MRRTAAAFFLAMLAVSACKKRTRPAADWPAAPVATDGGDGVDDAAARPDLSFVRGDVLVFETRDPGYGPIRLDSANGVWSAIGDADTELAPTGHRVRGGFLCIATSGIRDESHREQLAIVRGTEVERFGPRMGTVRNPNVTHNGVTIVVEAGELGYGRSLYAIGPDGSATRLTDDTADRFEPAVSPDGKTIVFASSRDDTAELYARPVAGGTPRRLAETSFDAASPVWSPDGKRLAFVSGRHPQFVYLIAPSGGSPTRLTTETAASEGEPRWSPDGATLAYQRIERTSFSVVLVDVASRKARTITPAGGFDYDFAWSPDGKYLAVTRGTHDQEIAIAFVRVLDGVVVAMAPINEANRSEIHWIAP